MSVTSGGGGGGTSAGRPPGAFGSARGIRASTGTKIVQSITAFRAASGSPICWSWAKRWGVSNRPGATGWRYRLGAFMPTSYTIYIHPMEVISRDKQGFLEAPLMVFAPLMERVPAATKSLTFAPAVVGAS